MGNFPVTIEPLFPIWPESDKIGAHMMGMLTPSLITFLCCGVK